jgi:hypothetical protein
VSTGAACKRDKDRLSEYQIEAGNIMETVRTAGHRDELARRQALRYAAYTMQFVRSETADWDHADFADAWFQQQQFTYHGHMGKQPLVIDARAQRYLENVVGQEPQAPEFGEVLLLGEEVAQPNWDPNRPGRTTIIRCDPIDGTSPLSHTGQGFASVVTVESRGDSGQSWKHLGGAIVRSDGRTISWSRRTVEEHHVRFDVRISDAAAEPPAITDLDSMPPLVSRDIDELHRKLIALSGAAVAAQSTKRRQDLLTNYSPLVSEAEYFDFQGGNPSAWQLCKGLLGWTIELNWTTIHDSIYLWPFSLLGGRVVDHDGKIMNLRSLIEAHAGPDALEKAVPPYISFVYDDSLEFINSRKSV